MDPQKRISRVPYHLMHRVRWKAYFMLSIYCVASMLLMLDIRDVISNKEADHVIALVPIRFVTGKLVKEDSRLKQN
jgi:hypothetical protein